MGQPSIERLKADDPCWHGFVWVTYERRIEPRFRGQVAVKLGAAAIDTKVPIAPRAKVWQTRANPRGADT